MQFPIGAVPHPTRECSCSREQALECPSMPQMPIQGTMQRYPLMSGRINLGALGQSQMQRSPQAY
jgi:hypothetical protein